MLFESQAENLTKQAYKMAVTHSEVTRKADAAKKLDYYNNSQIEHVLSDIQRKHKDPKEVDPVFLNVVRKVINLIARVYVQDCARIVDGTAQDQEIYSFIEDSASLPTRMKSADRLSRLLGTVMIRPLFRNGVPDMDILTGDVLDVVTGDSPEDIQAVMVTHAAQNGRPDEIEYILWTAEEVQHLDYSGKAISAEPNPYGVIPFVPVWSETPLDDFWLSGANDLINVQAAINLRLSGTFNVLHFQSHGVEYIKGAGNAPKDPITTGPQSVIYLPEKGEIGFAAPNAPTLDSLAAIDKLMKWVAVCNGLPASSLTTDPTEESGTSKLVGNSEIEEQRRDSIAVFAKVEQQLFNLWRIIWNVHNPGRQISEDATLVCDFYDPKPSVSGYERARELEKLIELNLSSRVDALIELNPDLTRDEARKRLAEIMAENEEFAAKEYSPTFESFAGV